MIEDWGLKFAGDWMLKVGTQEHPFTIWEKNENILLNIVVKEGVLHSDPRWAL